MFSFSKVKYLTTTFDVMIKSLGNMSLSACSGPNVPIVRDFVTKANFMSVSHFHTSHRKCDLMEFFDHKDNWGVDAVKVGRSWRKEELRLKSNSDLHKLWFVLLKEKNMLLTMEHESKDRVRLFPNPERIDKVEESMENLEAVVQERNRAYFELETGETGERQGMMWMNALGFSNYRKFREYHIPQFMNKTWRSNFMAPVFSIKAVLRFRQLYLEKHLIEKKRARRRNKNHVMGLIKRYPHMDMEAVKKAYPDVEVDKLRFDKKTRGHHEYNEA